MTPDPLTSRSSTRRGFTLVEAAVSILIVTILLVSSLSAVGGVARSRAHTETRARGPLLAQELMVEILGQAYTEPEYEATGLQPDAGESTPPTRHAYDDVDDYAGWSASPPQTGDGTPMTDLTGWTRTVDVQWANAADPAQTQTSDTGVKRITVTVLHDGVQAARLTALRTVGWPDDGASSAPRVLLVVTEAANPTAQEQARVALMESWGFPVSLITAADAQAAYDAAVADADVAYISEEVDSGDVDTKLTGAAIGVVLEEVNLSDEFGMATHSSFTNASSIVVLDAAHYITSPFSLGTLVVFTAEQPVHVLDGTYSTDLLVLAQTNTSGPNWKPSLATLDVGDDTGLYDTSVAAGRRVELPWGGNDLDINLLTSDGRTIMKRAIEWAASMEQP